MMDKTTNQNNTRENENPPPISPGPEVHGVKNNNIYNGELER
jgi:hypothetical protein